MYFYEFSEKWLKQKEGEVKSITITTYKHWIDRYMIPFLSTHTVEELKKKKMLKQYEIILRTFCGISDTTADNVMRLLNSMLFPKRPKKEKVSKGASEEVLDKKQFKKVIFYLKTNPSRKNALILLGAVAGIGPGELCAIKGRDINFQDNTIEINSVVTRNITDDSDKLVNTNLIESESTHIRTLKVADWVMQYLRMFETDDLSYMASGERVIYAPRNLQTSIERISKILDIKITFSILQSTFIENSLNNGASLKQIAQYIGSSVVQLEKRGYKEIEKFDAILKFQKKYANL